MAKPQIDVNNKRYLNGTKGGRPTTKKEPSNNQNKTKAYPGSNHPVTKAEPNVNDNGNENVNVNEKGNVNGKENGTALQGRQPHTFHPLFRRKSGNITGGECEWILPPGASERKGVKGSCLCSVSAS